MQVRPPQPPRRPAARCPAGCCAAQHVGQGSTWQLANVAGHTGRDMQGGLLPLLLRHTAHTPLASAGPPFSTQSQHPRGQPAHPFFCRCAPVESSRSPLRTCGKGRQRATVTQGTWRLWQARLLSGRRFEACRGRSSQEHHRSSAAQVVTEACAAHLVGLQERDGHADEAARGAAACSRSMQARPQHA